MKARKPFAFLLALVMLFSLTIPAFAENDSEYPEFDTLFTGGDSVCRGYGLGEPYYSDNPDDYINCIEGSYSALVAEKLDIAKENRTMLAYPALRARDVLYFLGGDIERDGIFDEYYKLDNRQRKAIRDSGGNPDDVNSLGNYFINALKDGRKTLVLLDGGPADIFFASLTEATSLLGGGLDDIGGLVSGIIEILWSKYAEFLEVYPRLIEKIREINEDTTIVLLGTFNPLKDAPLSGDDLIHLGDAFAVMSGLLNESIKAIAKENDCIYVDGTNAETFTLSEGFGIEDLLNGEVSFEQLYHPNAEGQAYLARQILAALKENKKVTTNIRVDLGSVKSVSSVLVGAMPAVGYRYDPETHILTVPYLLTNAKLLTVTEVKEDGAVRVAIYHLNWDCTNGYSAFALYSNFDIMTSVEKMIKSVFSTVTSITVKLFG